jgi:hypothetical protein
MKRELNYEEERRTSVHLMDILKKNTLFLTVGQMCRSSAVVLGFDSPSFVRSFLNQWAFALNRARLENGEIAYHWK